MVAALIRTPTPVTPPVAPYATVAGPIHHGNQRFHRRLELPPAASTIRFVMEWKAMPPDGLRQPRMVRPPSRYPEEIMVSEPAHNVMVSNMMVDLPNRVV